jgi:hypothetical protein
MTRYSTVMAGLQGTGFYGSAQSSGFVDNMRMWAIAVKDLMYNRCNGGSHES